MAHFVFAIDGGGYVGTRKNNGKLYESRPSAAADITEARVFNTKAAASRAGGSLGQQGKALAVSLTVCR
jgi:hypothetical protein